MNNQEVLGPLDVDPNGATKTSSASMNAMRTSEVNNSVGRRRSLSVSSAQPSVETVIVKAKRAASSLWMLLHAQNCTLAGNCPHPGCQEAKLVHLHLKTCAAAGGDFRCPTNHNGCAQARKLLGHYRRCRGLRARQAGQRPSLGSSSSHNCLVCSLVARQARSILDSKSTSRVATSGASTFQPRRPGKQSVSSFAVESATSVMLDSVMPPPPRRISPQDSKVPNEQPTEVWQEPQTRKPIVQVYSNGPLVRKQGFQGGPDFIRYTSSSEQGVPQQYGSLPMNLEERQSMFAEQRSMSVPNSLSMAAARKTAMGTALGIQDTIFEDTSDSKEDVTFHLNVENIKRH